MDIISLINLVSTSALFGLIWTIQLVHYPIFHYIEPQRFLEFGRFHKSAISYIVAPLMVSELIASIILINNDQSTLTYYNLICVLLIWATTFLISIPCHGKLALGYNAKVVHRLIQTNWIRTMIWSVKLIISLRIIF